MRPPRVGHAVARQGHTPIMPVCFMQTGMLSDHSGRRLSKSVFHSRRRCYAKLDCQEGEKVRFVSAFSNNHAQGLCRETVEISHCNEMLYLTDT